MIKRPTNSSAKLLTPAVAAFVGDFLTSATREDPNQIQDYLDMIKTSPIVGPAVELKTLLGLTLFDDYKNPTEKYQTHIRRAFEQMRGSLRLSVAELLVVEPLGFACSHWAPAQIGGKWMLDSIRGLDPRKYEFRGKLGEITDLLHEGTPRAIQIPYDRVIHLTNQSWLAFGDPQGVATCRRAIALHKAWKIAIAALVIAAKRRGEPILIGYTGKEDVIVGKDADGNPVTVPAGEAMLQTLQELENGSVGATDVENRIEALEAANGSLILETIKEIERLMLQSFLIPETMLRSTGVGDSNLNSGQRELLNLVVGSRVDQIKEALIEQIVRPLLEWEFGEKIESYGSFPVPAQREANANELLNTLINAVYNGAFSAQDLDVINRMRELAQLPPVEAIAKLEGVPPPEFTDPGPATNTDTEEPAAEPDPPPPVIEDPAQFSANFGKLEKEEEDVQINITLNMGGDKVSLDSGDPGDPGLFAAAKTPKKATGKAAQTKNCKKGILCVGPKGAGCISALKTCKNNQPQTSGTTSKKVKNTTTKPPKATKGGGGGADPDPTKTPAVSPAVGQPAVTTGTDPIKLNQAELDAKRYALDRQFGPKLIGDAEANVRRILTDADTNVFIRVGSADTLSLILGDRFKTSAELGITSHRIPDLADKNYQTARNRVEAKTLGYDLDTPDADRPIYGYLGGPDMRGKAHDNVDLAYGSIAVQLKPDAKARTSFTGADSFKSGIASKLDNPNAASLAPVTRFGYDLDDPAVANHLKLSSVASQQQKLKLAASAKTIDDLNDLAPTGNRYIEAQVHGGVKPADIAALHFSPRGVDDQPTPAIAKFAKDNGVDLFVNGKKVDPDSILKGDKRSDLMIEGNAALKKAIATGDFGDLATFAEAIDTKAKKAALAPGETDRYLKVLFNEAGYDLKPQVVNSKGIDDARDDGATLMLRGMKDAGKTPRTALADQLREGDYYVGNGVYGNGTYVAHASTLKTVSARDPSLRWTPGSSQAGAKNAVDVLKKHGYVGASSKRANVRMALPASAKVISQSSLNSSLVDFKSKLSKWENDEIDKIPDRPAKAEWTRKDSEKWTDNVNPDIRPTQNVVTHKGRSYKETDIVYTHALADKDKPVASRKVLMFSDGNILTFHDIQSDGTPGPAQTIDSINQKFKADIVDQRTSLLESGLTAGDFTVGRKRNTPNGNTREILWNPYVSNTPIKLDYDSIREQYSYDAGRGWNEGFTDRRDALNAAIKEISTPRVAPGSTGRDPAKIAEIKEKASKIRMLYRDAGAGRTGKESSGRFATMLGFDAIALNDSYEPSRFMNLLNRGAILIQDTNFVPGRAASNNSIW
jgi:hypothetical protein